MDENHQDKTESKLTATEKKSTPSSLSLQDQRGTEQIQNNQMEDTIKQLRDHGYKVTEEYSNTGQLSKVSQEIPPRKTWWDWLQLFGVLAIPLVVAGATLLFSIQQVNLAQQQHENDQKIANQQHEADKQSALDQQEATTLQTYIDNIQDLLLNHNLLGSKPDGDVAILARARTLTALVGLDSFRKGVLIQFLYEDHLIGYLDSKNKPQPPIIKLHGANLSKVFFIETSLTGANLSGTYLSGAYLLGVNLTGADLSDTSLYCSYIHFGDSTIAQCADLIGCDLTHVNLTGANLDGANLDGVNLTGANLAHAVLSRAKLTQVNLTHALLSQQQLDQVYSCKEAILDITLTCHHN